MTRRFLAIHGTIYNYGGVFYMHKDPALHTIRPTDSSGNPRIGGEDDSYQRELDAEGKSIGYDDPYAGGIPDPFDDMYQFGQEFSTRAGAKNTTYSMNGIEVPAYYVYERVFKNLLSGSFGLMEFSAQMSARGSYYTVGDERMPWTMEGADVAIGTAIETSLPIVQNWTVDESWSINWSLIDFKTQIDRTRRISGYEIANLTNGVKKALDNKKDGCRKYIKDLIEQAAKNANLSADDIVSTNMEELLMTVWKSRGGVNRLGGGVEYGGIFISRNSVNTRGNGWKWVGAPGWATIELSFPGKDTGEDVFLKLGTGAIGMSAIHELMHVALRSFQGVADDDIRYANAAADLAGEKRPVFEKGSDYSQFWDDRLSQACGFPSAVTNKFTNYRLYK